MPRMKTILVSPDAPKAIGPYSQGVVAQGARTLFLSGQIPLDPRTGELVGGGIEEQTRRVMENLRAVLAAGGAGFDHVVKTTIFLADLGDFAKVNEVYGGYFAATPPARATVQVAALPRGARVEIEVIAVVD
ncbi:MAG TPA: RidA family protein [Anaeromyxobacteraceae bacterium]|nr:RidA family protein [Anaeromyxobacteraceae bacterium]